MSRLTRRAWMYLRPWQRHSLVLAVGGLVYVLIGALYFATPVTDDRQSALRFALLIPMPVWGVAWIAAGLMAFASTRWPPASKTWGYVAMSSMSATWGSVYWLGIVFFGAPASGLTGTFAWYLFAFLWWGISGLMNPDDVVASEPTKVR